jgi:hypothetical protein
MTCLKLVFRLADTIDKLSEQITELPECEKDAIAKQGRESSGVW